MRNKLLALLTLLTACCVTRAQGPPPTASYIVYQSNAPQGACTLPNYLVVATVGKVPSVWQCTGSPTLTWQQVGTTAGVQTIDQLQGQFTFEGPGVSHVGNTYTFSGAGAGIGAIAWALPSWLAATPTTISASGTQTFAPAGGQTAHQVIGTCGTATSFAPCALVAADIPALPYLANSVQLAASFTATSHLFLNSYTASTGVFTAVQPAFADVSGSLGTTQAPILTGILKDSAGTFAAAVPGTDYLMPNGDASNLSKATTSAVGVVKPDGTSIIILNGVISSVGGGGGNPGGTNGQLQWNNLGTFAGLTLSGDATITPSTGVIIVSKTGGVAFAPSATVDTTIASNITTGTLLASVLPNPSATTLGGVESAAAVTNDFIDSISTSGVPHLSRPAFTNLSGALGTTQGPVLTGILKDTAGTLAVAAAGTDYLLPTGSSAGLSQATTSAFGVVKPDGTTITITAGVISAAGLVPGGTSGQLQYNNAGAFAGLTMSGDATIVPSTGVITVAKTGGVAFAPSATTDTTNASNISTGTLPAARLPNPSVSTLGGVEAILAVSNEYVDSISTSGVPHLSQPGFSNLAGALGAAQGPTSLTGLLKDTAGTLSVAAAGTDYLAPSGSSAALSQATTLAFGVVKPDGTTIGVTAGVISVVGTSFSLVGSGTNANSLVIGSGGSLSASGSGSINATLLGGVTLSGICQTGGTGCPQAAVTKTVVSHQFLTSYTSSTGLFTAAQPAFSDLSGAMSTTQGPPSLTGLLVDTAGTFSIATSANIISLWSGTCNSTTFTRGDGVCATPTGSGNTTSTSLITNAVAKANGANSIISSLFTDDGTNGVYGGTGGLSAAKFISTDTVNNGQDVWTTGSGGDSTCVANTGSNSFTNCIKAGIPQVSIGPSGPFVPYLIGTFPWSCQPGVGDGVNPIIAAPYPQSTCYNDTGKTITLTAIKCFTDNNGTSSMNVTNGAGTALLTGAITCSTSFAAGTQSGTITIAAGDFLKFSFVADGTTKQSTFVVAGNHP